MPRDAERELEPPPRDGLEGRQGRAFEQLRDWLDSHPGLLSRATLLQVLTVVALLGGALLILAEFLDLYQVKLGVVVVQERTSGDHHSYALLVVGVGVLVATLASRSATAWPPAAAAAALGLLALAVVLIGDLPDATSSGLTTNVHLAKAEPRIGFWVELAGAVVSIGAGGLLAFLLRR